MNWVITEERTYAFVNSFLDTSSLVKLYDPSETRVTALQQQMSPQGLIYLSTLAQVEFASVLSRKRNRAEMTLSATQALQQRFAADEPLYGWVEQTQSLRQLAVRLLETYTSLRALDAIQLASTLAVRAAIQAFFTHDQRLAAAALPVR